MPELDPKTKEAIAENVRTRRTLLGWTLEDLAEKAGMSAHGIWNIENQTRGYVRPSSMRKLAMALGCSVADLYGVKEGEEGPLAASPLVTPEALRWADERARWEHFQAPAAWLKDVAGDDLDEIGERQGRLIAERVRARRELQQLRREIEGSGPRHEHQDRSDRAKDVVRALERGLTRQHTLRMDVLRAIEDAMIQREVEKLTVPEVVALGEEMGLKAEAPV